MSFAEFERDAVARMVGRGIEIDVIYDIGAAGGMWSHVVNGAAPNAKYHLFEPQVEAYSEVLPGILASHPNFVMHHIALGAAEGQAVFKDYKNAYASSFVGGVHESVRAERSIPIRCLDTLRDELALEQPDFVKVDVQGYELSVLQGGEKTIRAAKALIAETWFYRGYGAETPLQNEIIAWLDERGFVLSQLGDYYRRDGQLLHIDSLFLRRDFAPIFL